MQRIICMLCEATICLNCGEYCGGFQRNFDLMEIHLFAPANIFQRPGDHTFCKVLTRSSASLSRVGALQYAIITEAYLDALHLSTRFTTVDQVPWINTDTINSLAYGFQSQRVLIVNISYQRNVDTLFDLTNGEGILFFGHGYAHYFTANLFQAMNLCHCTFYIARVCGSH